MIKKLFTKKQKKLIANDSVSEDKLIQMYEYKGKNILMIKVDDIYWFRAKELVEILGYVKPNQAVQKNIATEHKINFKSIYEKTNIKNFYLNSTINEQTLFTNINGLDTLISRNKYHPETKKLINLLNEMINNHKNKYETLDEISIYYDPNNSPIINENDNIDENNDEMIIISNKDCDKQISLTTDEKMDNKIQQESKNDLLNIFQYNGIEIMIIKINDDYWFKGKEVAEILGYSKLKQAIQYNISDNHKINYEELLKILIKNWGPNFRSPYKTDKQTLFIDEQSVYKLIFRSKKLEAEKFTDWVTNVIKNIRKHGSYSINANKIQYKSFYNDNKLMEYDNKNVLYIAYIGEYNNEQLFKFGKSYDYYRREQKEHMKTFNKFELLYLCECDNKEVVEVNFKKELQCRNLLREIKINNKS